MTLRIAVVDECARSRNDALDAIHQSNDITVMARSTTAADAMEIVRSLEPDILLLAPNARRRVLPTLQEIVDSRFSTKVAVLTSSAHRGDVLTVLRSGASGYILRSSAVSLAEALLQMHGSRIYVSPELGAHLLLDLARSQDTAMDPDGDWVTSRGCRLSEREREIVALVRQGCRNREIASRLELQEATVKQHLSNVFKKLQVQSRAELAALV